MLKRRSEDGSGEVGGWQSAEKKKKRKSRWASDEAEKTFIPGMPTVIPTGLSSEQESQYLVHLQIEEVSRRLRSGDLGIPSNPEERSPSPEPIYNNEGKRLNTREYRTRKRLEEERHELVTKALQLNEDYKPPADYKPPMVRVNDKVMIPQEEHPDINFVGLLIGPRGNTLKDLEKETGAKVIIRGRGSVKEGKIGRKAGQPLPGEDEPLHAYITANNPDNVKLAAAKIREIIEQGIQVPEGENDLRRKQLRQLALLNGTLRESDGLAKLKQLQEAQEIVTNQIICTICGGAGHLSKDCREKRPGDTFRQMQQQTGQAAPASTVDKAKMDSEYMSLMAELGEGPPPPTKTSSGFSNPPSQNRLPFRQSRFNDQPPPAFGRGHPPPLTQANATPLPPPRSLWDQPPPQQTPPSLLSLNTSSSFTPPTTSQPPPLIPPTSLPPPVMPPWQTNSGPPNTSQSSGSMGVPPRSLLSAPPPPPPSSQSSQQFPWQQPPPTSLPSSIPPPWQIAPPPPPSSLPPWQQHHAPPPPNPVAPPPPPPSSFGVAPPPPPPSQFDVIVNILGSRPPPPPPN